MVTDIEAEGDLLYVAGYFSSAGGLTTQGLAVYDRAKQTWRLPPDGFPLRNVDCLEVTHDGSIYAVGTAEDGGNLVAVRWHASEQTWTQLGVFDDTVSDIAVNNAGDVVAGGSFTNVSGLEAPHIARWKATTDEWDALGEGADGSIHTIDMADDGTVYVGGGDSFRHVDGVLVNRIARWDPETATWHALGGGLSDSFPYTSVFDLDVQGTDVYVGGQFDTAVQKSGEAVSVNGIARWNGQAWEALGEGHDRVLALEVSSEGTVYAGIQPLSPPSGPFLYAWSNEQWAPVPSEVIQQSGISISAMALDGSDLIVGGFAVISLTFDYYPSNFLFLRDLDTGAWTTLADAQSNGLSDEVYALTVTADEALYAGGFFRFAGGARTDFIARWDGGAWHAVGQGVDDAVYALAEGADGRIYAGGRFRTAYQADGSPVVVNGIAWYDPSTHRWSALGEGISHASRPAQVRALAFGYGPDGEPSLYVAGEFEMAGGIRSPNVARYDLEANTWHSLGQGVSAPALSLAYEATSRTVYVGGYFGTAYQSDGTDVSSRSIAAWDIPAQDWMPLLPPPGSGAVEAITVLGDPEKGGTLYVATPQIRAWDGSAWTDLEYAASALAMDPDNEVLYAGIRRWDGDTWEQIADPLGGRGGVHAIALDTKTSTLWLGGGFRFAGEVPSSCIARRSVTLTSIRVEEKQVSTWTIDSFPNPTRGSFNIKLELAAASRIDLELFDILGRKYWSQQTRRLSAGEHIVNIDAGQMVPAGMYFLRVRVDGRSRVVKVHVVP